MSKIKDGHNRFIDYLRISITDHCNLKCLYCVPFDGRPKLSMTDILTYEEMFLIAKAAAASGITKIRITGGEPLMRKNMIQFCRMLSSLPEITDIAITTNGVLLKSMAADLKEAGVNRINISLDTLKARRYAQITGKDELDNVLDGVETAAKTGLMPIKINMVPMRGVNDDEIADIASWTFTKPYDVRFIELMPTSGWAQTQHSKLFIPVNEIRKIVETVGPLESIPNIKSQGPAVYARIPGARGRIGFIAALSHHFCESCNRLRLTADGKLRACLFADKEVDIRPPLRQGASMNALQKIFQAAAMIKPKRHTLNDKCTAPLTGRTMNAIGG